MGDKHQQCEPFLEQVQRVRNMFKDWVNIFGTKVQDRDFSLRTAKMWTVALIDLGVTHEQFEKAERIAISQEWCPTSPRDFYELALADIRSQFPDMRQAYTEAANGIYKHEVIRETAKRVGITELKRQTESKTYPLWQLNWHEVCGEYLAGKRFNLPQERCIEQQPHKPTTPAKAKAYLAQLKKRRVVA